MQKFQPNVFRRVFIVLIAGLITLTATLLAIAAMQIDIVGPSGSGTFGGQVVALPNGNIIVTDPSYDAPGSVSNVGAVYLYNGATHALISRLTGSVANDRVGYGGVTVLSNGNFVVQSPLWDNGAATDAGAATWGSGTTGITGVVAITNSLVGGTMNDQIGSSEVVTLSNGNYVVASPLWDNGAVTNAGAVTWGNGTTGTTGVVSVTNSLVGSTTGDTGLGRIVELKNGNYVVASRFWNNGAGAVTWSNGATGRSGVISVTNSLVGTKANDKVGMDGVTVLSNGNYIVPSPYWDNGVLVDAGATTWGNGTTGITGTISAANSLVGSTTDDRIGLNGVTPLSNGNYVVCSPIWNNGSVIVAGAATWGNGATGITGVVTITNSLVGGTAFSQVGLQVFELSNGNYVVRSPGWNNGAMTSVGAATWGNGTTGITGVVSLTNSLVGSAAGSQVGGDIVALSNGNYVVVSSGWDNGPVTNVGAVTWGNGTTGITGVVSVTNSLVGVAASDGIGGYGVYSLENGNYVALSPSWDNGLALDIGAVTWGNGATGSTGVVSVTNSLVGSTAGDLINGRLTALNNGNYVVGSSLWDNGPTVDAGAVTWANGAAAITGVISVTNSLVGSTADDQVGFDVWALSNGNYVMMTPYWDNGTVTDVGAVTWGSGTTGLTGVVSITNSLVGNKTEDYVGDYGLVVLSNGDYVVQSPSWANGTTTEAGAVTLGNGRGGTVGFITADNSVRGSTAGGGEDMSFDYDYLNNQLVVGRPWDNIVTLFRNTRSVYLPVVIK
jgi:hypothetical protein